jgi:hypothetical protein
MALTLASSLSRTHAATSTLTVAEQEVLNALFSQDAEGRTANRLVIEETTSVRRIRGDSHQKFATDLRKEALAREPAFKEALEDFLQKNKEDTKIAFPPNASGKLELAPEAVLKEIFSVKRDAKPSGWDRFYERFPESSGLITISQVGIDSKGTTAIVYLGRQTHYRSGRGYVRVMKRQDKKWILSYERIGTEWVS